MTDDELRQAFPIDGRKVIAGNKEWTVSVRGIADGGSSFDVALVLEGSVDYAATLHLDKSRLVSSDNMLEIDLILTDLAEWLLTSPPLGNLPHSVS